MNPITKAQALAQLTELIDGAQRMMRWADKEERAWHGGRVNAAHDAMAIVKAIDSLDEVPDEVEA